MIITFDNRLVFPKDVDISPELQDLLLLMLEKDPKKRIKMGAIRVSIHIYLDSSLDYNGYG